jgi:hypothetical protein
MKTILNKITLLFIILLTISVYGQAKKPSILIIPSDNWCIQNKYYDVVNDQGTERKIMNYKKAVQENFELLAAVNSLENILQERGFPPKNLEQTMKSLEMQKAKQNMVTSFDSGSSVAVSAADELNSIAKADIIIQFSWKVTTVGPRKTLSFIISAFDSYTQESVGGADGAGEPTISAGLDVLVKEAVIDKMPGLLDGFQLHFDDMFENGRKVSVDVRTWDDWGYSLMDYFGDEEEELGIIIEDWLAENTVQGRFNTADYTDTAMKFESVRIPLFTERKGRQRALDTRSFVSNLRRFLKSNYDIDAKVDMEGLGKAILTIGGK